MRDEVGPVAEQRLGSCKCGEGLALSRAEPPAWMPWSIVGAEQVWAALGLRSQLGRKWLAAWVLGKAREGHRARRGLGLGRAQHHRPWPMTVGSEVVALAGTRLCGTQSWLCPLPRGLLRVPSALQIKS